MSSNIKDYDIAVEIAEKNLQKEYDLQKLVGAFGRSSVDVNRDVMQAEMDLSCAKGQRSDAIRRINTTPEPPKMAYSNDPDVLALIQKKKDHAIKAIEDEKFIREILKDNIWNQVLQSYNRYSHEWQPFICPVDKMMESYNIINNFKSSIENDVKNVVKEYIDEWWGKNMDVALQQPYFEQYWVNYGCPFGTILNKLRKDDDHDLWHWDGNTYGHCSPPPPPKHWKGMIVRHMADPLIQTEFPKLQNFYYKYKERSKRVGEPLNDKIQSLENEIKVLKERNELLEEKFAVLKTLANIQ